jgi:hypothetical protein
VLVISSLYIIVLLCSLPPPPNCYFVSSGYIPWTHPALRCLSSPCFECLASLWLDIACGNVSFFDAFCRVGAPLSPEDGNRSSFRNVVFPCLWNSGRWTKSRNVVVMSVTHHGQNPLECIKKFRIIIVTDRGGLENCEFVDYPIMSRQPARRGL